MERYEDNIILKTNQNKQYFKGKFYPNIPLSESDNYIITTIGDRLDTLAYQYYGDSTLWWVIAMANNNVTKGFLYPEPGTQLRIPININSVITEFNNFNNAR
jgi:nucleoid-associated protein YgaU